MSYQVWRKIDSAPEDKWIEVCGDSDMKDPRWFIAIARYDAAYTNPWRDVQNDALSDNGWKPLYWRPRSTFPKKDPAR